MEIAISLLFILIIAGPIVLIILGIKAGLKLSRKMEDEGYEFIGGTWVDPHKFNPDYKSPRELREEEIEKGKIK